MTEKNKAAQELGKLGGVQSVKNRFKGKTKKEISEEMKRVRKSNADFDKETKEMGNDPELAKDIADWHEQATGKKLT